LALRIGRYLERQGLLERDAEISYLAGDDLEASPMEQLLGSSITYRIAIGPQQGRKVFTLQTLPACDEPFDDGVGKVAGLHSVHPCTSPLRGSLQLCKSEVLPICRCMPACRHERINARSSNGCVATSAGRPSRKSACRSPRTATSVTT